MASWRVLWWTMSAQETRTWRKEGQKPPKSAKTAVRSNMHQFEINPGPRYSSYAYPNLPHRLIEGLSAKWRQSKEQEASSWWSKECRKADFGDFCDVVVAYGANSSLWWKRDFKEGWNSLQHIKKALSTFYQQDLAWFGGERQVRVDENKMGRQRHQAFTPRFHHFLLKWDDLNAYHIIILLVNHSTIFLQLCKPS